MENHELVGKIIKDVILRIKEVQEDFRTAYTQEDAYHFKSIEGELIDWKIKLEKCKKSLRN